MQRRNSFTKNRISVQSVSFDGCLFNDDFYPDSENLKARNAFRDEKNRAIREARFFEANKVITFQMAAYITKQFDEAIFMVGSFRQNVFYDELNPESHLGAGSCFPYLEALCERVSKHVGNDGRLRVDPYLLADTFGNKSYGENMRAAQGRLGENVRQYHFDESLRDTSKLTIIYAQMHKIASENPAAEIVFDYYSADNLIINKLHVFFNNHSDLMPGNVRLRLHQYNGGGVDVKPVLRGTGGIDYNFNSNVKLMVECAGYGLDTGFDVHVMDSLRKHMAEFKRRRQMAARIIGPMSATDSFNEQLREERGTFNPDNYLSELRHQIGLLKENLEGRATRKDHDFVLSLENLHRLCHEEVAKQASFNVSPSLIEKSEAVRVATHTESLIRNLMQQNDDQECMNLVHQYQQSCHQTSRKKKILKVVACVVAGAIGFVVGGAIGLGIGVGAGAFLGPGAGVAGLAGMIAGATAGAKAGLAIGATLAGATAGGLTAFGLFRRSKVQQYADRVVDKATKIYQPQEASHYNYSILEQRSLQDDSLQPQRPMQYGH